MADFIDLAQAREQEDRERHINSARRLPATPSRFLCEDCEPPIPEALRMAVPGVALCITCQEIAEMKNKHIRGG